VEEVSFKNVNFQVWDVGGQTKIRPLWKHYFIGARAIIFVVDSIDVERMQEAQLALADMLSQEELRNSTLLVLANKQDLPGALQPTTIAERLKLHSLGSRAWHISATCAVTGEGVYEGLDWLAQELKKSARCA
jgi:small GTP-binding protein